MPSGRSVEPPSASRASSSTTMPSSVLHEAGPSSPSRARAMAGSPETSGVDLVAAFTRLQSLTLSTAPVGEFLSELAAVAPQLGGPAMSCSITVQGEHRPYTMTASDDLASRVDEVQYDEHEGPCLQALRDGVLIYVEDMHDETRWPGYRERAVAVGMRSSMSLPP